MSVYMTPEKYKTMGFGIDLEGIEEFELAATLARASALAESYCAVPRLPNPHSFLGGTITTTSPEQHPWRLPENDFDPGSRRVYPYHWPIKAVTNFKVKVTNTQFVSIAASEMFINNTERYVEVISLAFTGVGLFGAILPTLGLMRPVAELAYTYGYSFSEVGEIVYATDARTYRAQHQFWASTGTKVYVNGVEQTTGFTVDTTEGTVVFSELLDTGSVVTVDYTHFLPWEIRDAVGVIATHLFGEREQQARGMTGVRSLAVAEVKIVNEEPKLTANNMSYMEPEAATLLDGFKFFTVR